ncbi:MAG: LUD domain-containing protein [Aigarchaeota archaeon]|nr:LUD domain-containing protein [Aigarchaeota archaeon]MDW8092831.1 LUD domain-containing protein [Nitrososphaerota archaeon]
MIKSVIDGLRDRMSSLTELTDETDVTNLPEYRRDNLIYVVESSYAVADTGSVIVVASPRERLSIATATDLIVVLHEYEVFDDLLEASELLRSLASEGKVINLITGPSSTTDIESIVVVGAHGPPRLVIAINDEVKGGGS